MPQNLNIFQNSNKQVQTQVQHSLELFGPLQSISSTNKQGLKPLKKNDYFRQQIRRTTNQKLFRSIRNQMMNNDQTQRFLTFLRQNSQKFSVNQSNLETLIQCIKNHMKNADFSVKLLNQDIKIYKQMTQILMNEFKSLTTYTKAVLVKGLIYLTYIQKKVAQQIATSNFIDFCFAQITQLKIDNNDQVQYLLYYISLIMNISASQDKDINLFFIESNLINLICQKIGLTFVLRDQIAEQSKSNENKNLTNSQTEKQKLSVLQLIQQDISNLYFAFIMFLKNLCKQTDKPSFFVENIISYFSHKQFVLKHNTSELLDLLTEIFKDENNIRMLFENCQFSEWYGQLVDICQQKFINYKLNSDFILTKQEKECFANFLKNFINIDKYYMSGQITLLVYIKQLINLAYLSQFLIQTTQNQEKQLAIYAFQAYEIISNQKQTSIDFLLTVAKGRDYQILICAFVNQYFLNYFKTGATVTKIIINLLSKSSDILKILMEMKLFESIIYFFKNDDGLQNKPIENIILIFDLMTLMVECQRQMRPNNKNQIVRLIMEQGLIKQIQKTQNNQKNEVFHKGEMFIKYIQTFL